MNLYPHQIDALNRTKDFDNVAYFLDMGLGKTYVGSEKMVQFGNDANLVVCQKSKVKDWVNHFKTYYPNVSVYDLTKPKELDKFTSWYVAWHGFHGASTHVAVINYELAWRRKDLLELHDFTLMLDESSLIQNKTAKQTKFILKLKPKNVILLSGTPTSGKYENLWTQAQLLNWNISEDLYNKHYVNYKTIETDGFFHKIVDMDDPYKNVERLKQKFRDHGAVFVKTEDVFDLPSQTFVTISVPTSKEYRKFMKHGIVQLTDGTELIGDQIFTKRLYSRQLCGIYSNEKLDAFKELVQSTNDRLVVFYNFKDEVKQLMHVANELHRPWSIISGDNKTLSAYENHDDSITFIQYQAGAKGLNLQLANKMVFYSPTEKADDWMQSQKRIHRIGQNRPCFYYKLVCENSVEELIYQTLNERKDWTDKLFLEKTQ